MSLVKHARKKPTKFLELTVVGKYEVKDATGDLWIEGYANTVSKDRVGDVVLPEAFEKTLPLYMTNPVMLENHDWDKPAGFIGDARTDEKGLWIRARVTDAREDLKTMCREGTLRTFSIGYNEVTADYDDATKTKIIKELELLEISIVTVPANAEAIFAPSGSEAAPQPKPEADAEPKAAPKSNTAQGLLDFINDVKSAVDADLTNKQMDAVCAYYISTEETMTKKELIAILREKTAIKTGDAAPGAVPAPAAAGSAGQTQPTNAPSADNAIQEALKQLAAKLDAIAQGVAQCLEGMKDPEEKPAGDKPADADKKPEDGKPADDGKAKPADADKDPKDEDDDKEANDDEMEKHLAEIAALEAELENESDEA